MLEGKLMLYKGFKEELEAINDPTVSKFKDYYLKTQEFKINEDFNFIPEFMLDKRTTFYQQLIADRGFKSTEWGLVKPGSKTIPLVEFK